MPAEGERCTFPTAREMCRIAAALLERLRACAPRVHCITNAVAQKFTANVLLVGRRCALDDAAGDEIGPFVAARTRSWSISAPWTVSAAKPPRSRWKPRGENVPWVLDPVFIDRSPLARGLRPRAARERPGAVRLNGAEFSALSGSAPTPEAGALTRAPAKSSSRCRARPIWSPTAMRLAAVANGHPLMAKVTAMGCAASALVAACLAVEPDAWRAAAARC